MTARRSKTKFTQIHVSIPVHTLIEFDNVLSFKESRSRKISMLMKNYLSREDSNLQMMTTEEVLEFIQFRFKKNSAEDVLIQSLLQILTK
jgi:metal-responsive CopG/Arc/MetJ family transcriptional regulator